jgi:general secretion pathway protein K
LVTIDELALVSGYTPGVLTRLRPFVTALPASAGAAINVNTAPPEILSATIDGLSLDDANRLAASRLGRPITTIADFRSRLPSGIRVNENVLRTTSEGFVVRVFVRQGEVRANALALVMRKGPAWPSIVWQMIE